MRSRMFYRMSLVFLFLFLAGAFALRTNTATLEVDPDGSTPYATIQSAIDAATPGADDVFVRCGVYHEHIVMRDAIPVQGQSPKCTIIDGQHSGVAVTLDGLGPQTVLTGFTIRNGSSVGPTGGGVKISGGAPVITRNVIEGNGDPFGPSGAAVFVDLGFVPPNAPVISYNIIRDNEGLFGGAVSLWNTDGARVAGNLFVGNVGYYGGAMYVQSGNPHIINNTLIGNSAYYGGGIFLATADAVVANNVIVGNSTITTDFGCGGGVFDPSGSTFTSNDVFDNTPDNFCGRPDPVGTDGNISVDPMFVDAAGTGFVSFQPRSHSPLVDAGSDAWAATGDLRGVPRPRDGNADGVARTDIGARENEGLTNLRAAAAKGTFLWDAGNHTPQDYNVYRGDLATLRQTGEYTQDPDTFGARHFCDVMNTVSDPDLPDPGQVFFYLPVAWGMTEGGLGFDSVPNERPKTLSCQGP